MKAYTDIISGDELFSDLLDVKVVDDLLYVIEGKRIHIYDGALVLNESASAEDDDECVEGGAQTVIDVVHSCRLQREYMDKKDYIRYLKNYLRRIQTEVWETNPDRVPAFEKNATAFAKKVIGNFEEYDLYTGESMYAEGMIVLCSWKDYGMTPTFFFWKDGLKVNEW